MGLHFNERSEIQNDWILDWKKDNEMEKTRI